MQHSDKDVVRRRLPEVASAARRVLVEIADERAAAEALYTDRMTERRPGPAGGTIVSRTILGASRTPGSGAAAEVPQEQQKTVSGRCEGEQFFFVGSPRECDTILICRVPFF